jgi:hypothetical protein
MSWYEWRDQTLIINLHIQPRASRDELVGPHGDRLKVRITAPPVDGKANEHLIRFLAKTFGVPKSNVTLISGETGRDKRIGIANPTKLPPLISPEIPSR